MRKKGQKDILSKRGILHSKNVLYFQINYQESMKKQTFLHSLLESTMRNEDVEEGVVYLLTHGANVMLKSQFSNENIVLPVHVAVKMQIDPVIKTFCFALNLS